MAKTKLELLPVVTRLVEWNTARIQLVDGGNPNPRRVADDAWYQGLVTAHPAIRAEWDAFAAAGGDLPLIEELLGFPDQNEGSYWKMAPFVSSGKPVAVMTAAFPRTIEALLRVPGLRAASWSVLGPGGWIPEHVGPNGGCLRLLVAVDAGAASVRVGGHEASFVDGEGVLFEDIVPHSVSNPGDAPRVVILCDLYRPLTGVTAVQNWAVQQALHVLTPPYRNAARRGTELFARMNPELASA